MSTLKQLVRAAHPVTTIVVAAEYGRDERQLAAQAAFQHLIGEIPKDYNFDPEIDAWTFSRMLQEQCRQRGCTYRFIGTPMVAARLVITANEILEHPGSTQEQRDHAVAVLTGE